MKEENRQGESNGIHSYEVQKIEVLDEETPNTPNGVGTLNSELEGYPLAKLIKDVSKTIEPDKKLLDESKKDGKRKPENGNNENILVHRFVEVINVDGKEYRVKTTMLEYKQADMTSREYAYDVTNIEVLDDTKPSTPDDLDRAAKGLQPLSKVMKKLEKSYDGGKKLEESEIADDDRVNKQVQY